MAFGRIEDEEEEKAGCPFSRDRVAFHGRNTTYKDFPCGTFAGNLFDWQEDARLIHNETGRQLPAKTMFPVPVAAETMIIL